MQLLTPVTLQQVIDTIKIGLGSTLNLLSNAGTIYSTNPNAIYNQGSINSIYNSGQIQASQYTIYNVDTLSSLTNTNLITATFIAIDNGGTLGTITNSGTISASLGLCDL